MISFDANLLTSYYNAKLGISSSSSGASGAASGAGTDKTYSPTGSASAPKAPWSYGSSMAQESDLVKNVLAGHSFINANAVTSDVLGASADYAKLFTLYQGLSALEGLATKAQDDKLSDLQMAAVRRRFLAGMGEVGGYIQDASFDHMSLTAGSLTDQLKTTDGTARTDSTYIGANIHTGSATSAVKAFEGDVQFTLSVKKIGTATPFTVDIDLADMGSQTRSMANVVSFINSKLKEQGLSTKFVVNRTPAVPETQTINGKTVTLSKGVDSFGLKIQGVSYETLTITPPVTADSVYVVQTSGDPDKKTVVKNDDGTTKKDADGKTVTETGANVSSQMLKFTTDPSGSTGVLTDPVSKPGDVYWTAGEDDQTQLADSITNVRQTVSGSDGSVYVLADVEGKINNQDIKGNSDVAVIKYDSAGKVVWTRTLGASETASGYAMAVSDDGHVAIAGSVTGALNISKTETKTYGTGDKAVTSTSTTNVSVNGDNPSLTDSFVTVFDSYGTEEWTQRRAAANEDEATSVAFGNDGSVYVGGRAKSLMKGATGGASGGWDGYLMGFSAAGDSRFTVQTGTTNSEAVSQVVVDGSNVYTAGIEDGNAVVRGYALSSHVETKTVKDANGQVVKNGDGSDKTVSTTVYTADATGTRNLGGIGGGTISGIAIDNGKLYLGGSSGSSKLMENGDVTRDYSGGYDAFALSLDADLSDASGDTIAFYGGAGAEKDAKVVFSNGKAWIAGGTTGAIDGTTASSVRTGVKDAYLARLDIGTGNVEYQTRYAGIDNVVSPSAIGISTGGSSVLDRLGLPQGTIQQKDLAVGANGKTEDYARIVSSTSVRTGDQFYMIDPSSGVRKTITIDANETMESLAKKIVRASGYKLKVDVSKMTGKALSQLVIKPANSTSKMEFAAGPAGRDALEGLGLAPGLVTPDAGKTMDASKSNYLKSQKPLGLDFDASLNLATDANIKTALASLKTVMKNVQKAYNYLKYGDPQDTDTSKKGNTSGKAPAYITDQIANYQAALNRLTGGA